MTLRGVHFAVRPVDTEELCRSPYDLALFTIGYESRARFAAHTLGPCAAISAAIGFDQNRVGRYYSNLRWFSAHGFMVDETGDEGFAAKVAILLERVLAAATGRPRILIDISSLSRSRMATVVIEIERIAARRAIDADFVYSPAAFSRPREEDAPIVNAGPVAPSFAGWSSDPDAGAVAIIGLGYEPRRAAGIVELLEPAEVWAFLPHGTDDRFLKAIQESNRDFWPLVDPARVVDYTLSEPHTTFLALESLVARLSHRGLPILVPFGPKIFNLCCLFAALATRPNVALWRVSSGRFHTPHDRKPNGLIVALRACVDRGAVEGS